MQDELARDVARRGDDDAIRTVLREVCALTGMGFAAVARVTDTRWIACQVLDKIDFGLTPGEELVLSTTICDDIRETGDAVVMDSFLEDPKWRTHPTPTLYGFQSYASFPLTLADGSFFGTLCAIDPDPHPLNRPEVVAALRGYAARVAAILSASGTGLR